MFLWERLEAASPGPISPYLANFVTKKVVAKRPATTATRTTAKKSTKSKRIASDGPSLVDVLAEVHAAIEAVIGSRAGDDQPLMEAGLDSLGEILVIFDLSLQFSKHLDHAAQNCVICPSSVL